MALTRRTGLDLYVCRLRALGSILMAMEVMRLLHISGVRPRRTIRLALWSGEAVVEFANNIVVQNGWRDEWVCPQVGVWLNGDASNLSFTHNDVWGNVAGDYREVQKYCQQNIINPFKGYVEKERNILDDRMKDTVKEFSAIDGAFVLKGNGVIVSAGTTLRPTLAGEEVPKGLGSRHAVAAAITANTKSIAITVSESTTAPVLIWRMPRSPEKGARIV